ncbi:MAG TPA: CbtA family protein [Pseudonocardiaceae bacterium]|nr:CbtA family protein [Pseudonocardiaceae bacterium]
MIRFLLIRGMFSGLVAGLLAVVFALIFGEPPVDRAIDFESALRAARGEAPEPELVSRTVQSTIGLTTAVVPYAVVFGGVLALAFAITYGRVGGLPARATAVILALGGYLIVYVVPFLKYPASPPAVGNPDTISERTATYFGMAGMSVALAISVTYLGRRLSARLGAWNAALFASAVFIAAVTVTQFLFPTINEVPEGFPATVLWNFRIASLGTQLVIWATIGLLFGPLVYRRLESAAPLTR